MVKKISSWLIVLLSIAVPTSQPFGGSLLPKSMYKYYLFHESSVYLPPFEARVHGKLLPSDWSVKEIDGKKTKIHKGPYHLVISFIFSEEVDRKMELSHLEVNNGRLTETLLFNSFETKEVSYNRWSKDYRAVFQVENIDLPYADVEISGTAKTLSHSEGTKEVQFRFELETDYQEGESVDLLENIRGV